MSPWQQCWRRCRRFRRQCRGFWRHCRWCGRGLISAAGDKDVCVCDWQIYAKTRSWVSVLSKFNERSRTVDCPSRVNCRGVAAPTSYAGLSRGYGFYLRLSVCLFFHTMAQNLCSSDHQTCRRNVPRWVLETLLFWGQKVKVTSHGSIAGVAFALLWVLTSSSLHSPKSRCAHFDCDTVIAVSTARRRCKSRYMLSRHMRHQTSTSCALVWPSSKM